MLTNPIVEETKSDESPKRLSPSSVHSFIVSLSIISLFPFPHHSPSQSLIPTFPLPCRSVSLTVEEDGAIIDDPDNEDKISSFGCCGRLH